MSTVFIRILSAVMCIAACGLCVRRWDRGWSLHDVPDAGFPDLVRSPGGLRPARGADLWRLANNHHLLARTLVHEADDLPLGAAGVLATSVLSPELSGLLVTTLGLTPELAAVAVTPALDHRLSAACPAIPPHLARRCDVRSWRAMRQELPAVLAGALVDGDDRLAVEVIEVACADPTLAAGVARALRASAAARQGAPRPAALALFLDDCTDAEGSAARRALTMDKPVQWMAALELARVGAPPPPPPPPEPTLTAALLRYSAMISSSRTAEPSSP